MFRSAKNVGNYVPLGILHVHVCFLGLGKGIDPLYASTCTCICSSYTLLVHIVLTDTVVHYGKTVSINVQRKNNYYIVTQNYAYRLYIHVYAQCNLQMYAILKLRCAH